MQIHGPSAEITEVTVTLNDENPGDPFAVIRFGPAQVFVESTDDAYKVIAAGIAALRLLDPDAPVQLAADVDADPSLPGDDLDDGMDDRFDGPDDDDPALDQFTPAPVPGPLPSYTEPACTRCGSTELIVPRDGVWGCWNRVTCGQRQAAKAGAR